MQNFFKYLLLVAMILYVISPVDAAPGPVDDLLILLWGSVAGAKIKQIT